MFRLETVFLCLLLVVGAISEGYGQIRNKDGTIDCTEPTLIEVSSDQILMISSDNFGEVAMENDHIVFYKESDQYTFWYKIVVNHSCYLRFDILPSDKSDFYNFYLYKYDGSNFCKGVIDNTLIPFKANQFEAVDAEQAADIRGGSAESVRQDMHIYYKPIRRVIGAEKGEVYYLNVHHFVGEDCGHTIEFTSCKNTLTIEARHKPCYERPIVVDPILEELERLKSITSIVSIAPTSLEELEVEDIAMEQIEPDQSSPVITNRERKLRKIELKQIALDIRTEKILHAEIEIFETYSGIKVGHLINDEGVIEAELLVNTDYTIKYSSLGYKSLLIDINGLIEDNVFQQPTVSLKPESIGTNIVLNNIYFHPNTHVFRNGSEFELERLLNFLKDNEQAKIQIQGHTNGDYKVKSKAQYSHLGEAWNFSGTSKKLSKLRASEVRAFLTSNGIDDMRLSILGLGGEHMIIPDPEDYEDRLVNMRVEIVIRDI